MWRLRKTGRYAANGALGVRSIKVAWAARQTGLRVSSVPGLFDKSSQALGLEVDRLRSDRQLASTLVQLFVVSVEAMWMCHVSMFGGECSRQQLA